MSKVDALKLTIAGGLGALALALGCSSTTQVKGSGKSGTGGTDGGTAGNGGAGNSTGDGGASGAAGTGARGGAGGNAGAGGAGAGGAGGSNGNAGAGGTLAGAAGDGAAGTGGAGGVAGAGGSSGAAGAGGISGAAGVGGTGGNGCSVVSCSGASSCCTGTAVFVLDTPAQNYRDRPELVTRVAASTTSMVAEFRFDAAGQRGNIGFDLSRPIDVVSLIVEASYSGVADYPYVGLETGGGARGCAYALAGTEADLSYPLFCWGSPGFLIAETTRINVRVDSNAAGPASLSIRAVDVY